MAAFYRVNQALYKQPAPCRTPTARVPKAYLGIDLDSLNNLSFDLGEMQVVS